MSFKYFTLDKQDCLIDLNGREAKLKYQPMLENFRYRVELLLQELVEESKKRNFEVEGFDFEFCFNIDEGYIYIWKIENEKLDLLITHDSIKIKGMHASIFNDGSGSLDVYALDNWEEDKKEFMHGKLFHRKMDKKSRLCLHYDLRDLIFKATDDIGRGYYPNCKDEPEKYSYHDVNSKIRSHLIRILKQVKRLSIPEPKVLFKQPDSIQLTNDKMRGKKLYAYRETRWLDREHLKSPEIHPNRRLLSFSEPTPKDHSHRDIMHDGFIYMELEQHDVPKDTDFYQSIYNGKEYELYEVNPSCYNSFYVIDSSVLDKLKAKWAKKNSEAGYLTDEAFLDFKQQQAFTMVPINEYNGGYERPIVITNRIIQGNELKKIKEFIS